MSDDLQRYFEQEFTKLDAELAEQDVLAEQLTTLDLQVARRTQKIAQMASTCEEDLNPRSSAARLVRALREGGLSEAIRNIYKASKIPLTAVDVLNELKAINFPLAEYQNVHATIHLTLKRLETQTELLPVQIGSKTAFTWNPSTKPRWARHIDWTEVLKKSQEGLKPPASRGLKHVRPSGTKLQFPTPEKKKD